MFMYSGKPKAIRWYDDGVQLTSPSLIQCQEVVFLFTYEKVSHPYVTYWLIINYY